MTTNDRIPLSPIVNCQLPIVNVLLFVLLLSYGCQRSAPPDRPSRATETRQTAKSQADGISSNPEASGTTYADMALIKGGKFLMGTDEGFPYEGPAHEVTVKTFWMDRQEVTVAAFTKFAEATGYKTEAEKFGWSGVFDIESGEWKKMDGANWRHPDGPSSKATPEEPVTQVSWSDAVAYAKWANKRLPTEAEWEYAARGGLAQTRFGWGNEIRPHGKSVANWWQGKFPERNTGEDGYLSRAPVGKFPPNGYGLNDVAGNVWEWCSDWYDANYYATSPGTDPHGPANGTERIIRGGSWMCSENYCLGFRAAARSHATPDSGLNNLGFRCARDN